MYFRTICALLHREAVWYFIVYLSIIVPVLPLPSLQEKQNLRTIIVIADIHRRLCNPACT